MSLDEAVAALVAGDVVGLPTETVYGLAADAGNRAAVEKIYRIKGRPADHPLIVHVLDVAQAQGWGEWNDAAQRLADAFWPGPLTIVLRRLNDAPPWACAGHETIALRCPSHPVAREVLAQLRSRGVTGLAAPSANRFGRVSPTSAAHVRADLGNEVPIVLEGGPARVGIESTIVDLSRGRPYLLRPGHVSVDAIAAVLAEPVAAADVEAPRVSGSLASHYAPLKPLRLVASRQLDLALAKALSAGQRVAVWSVRCPRQLSAAGGASAQAAAEAGLTWLARSSSVAEVERDLYRTLRELDAARVDLILVESPPQDPAWAAVNDRLQRAAAPQLRSSSGIE